MAPLPPRRRVSYSIPVPPSADSVPRLWLPPLGYDRQGSVDPIVIPNSAQHPSLLHILQAKTKRVTVFGSLPSHSTLPPSSPPPFPRGYPLHRRLRWSHHSMGPQYSHEEACSPRPPSRNSSSRWELLTGWVDPVIDDVPGEGQELHSDGGILGDVRYSSRRRGMSDAPATSGCIPFEHEWESDVDLDAFRPGQVRLLLCALCLLNYNLYFQAFHVPSGRAGTLGLGE